VQALIAYLIVAVAACAAAWMLMPGATRRRLVAALPLSARWKARLGAADSGCGTCGGCAPEAGVKPRVISVVRPERRAP
jgi:hypothetical protein